MVLQRQNDGDLMELPKIKIREFIALHYIGKWEPAGKPGSVVDNHSSGTAVTSILKRPTRRHRGPR